MATPEHKAPTQVSVASTSEETALHAWVRRYGVVAGLAAVGVVVAVLVAQWLGDRAEAERAASWDRLAEEVSWPGFAPAATTPPAPAMTALADELAGSPAGPWARLLEVSRHVEDASFDEAAAALAALEQQAPEHVVTTAEFEIGEAGYETLPDFLLARLDAMERWEREHETLFRNPPPPPDAPKVRLNTSKGSILVGLYPEKAPKHVENFLRLAEEGFYDETLFHRVQRDFMIQGGDPNTREGDPATWGTGGPGYTIEAEISDLRHFPYVLAAAKRGGETESSGSQFYVTTGAPHHLDGQHTVFGAVLDGRAVVNEIAAGEIAEGTADRPRDPVVLHSVDRVE